MGLAGRARDRPSDGDPVLTLAGSTAHGRPHLAGLDGFAIDAELAGTMLVTRHHDRPGIVGAVGTILADAGINISSLELSRLSERGEAMMFVSVDDAHRGAPSSSGSARPTASSRRASSSCRVRRGPPHAYHRPMPKPFATSADLAEKEATLERLADGVFAYTAQGDPNVGCIVGTDAILAIEARATPFMAQQWIDVIRAASATCPSATSS